MKINFRNAALFAFVASLSCLSAQDASEESAKEVSMSQCPDRNACPEDCRQSLYQREAQARVDDYDYDVYTSGNDDNGSSDRSSSCRTRKCPPAEKSGKSNCNNQCKRKSAASAAKE